MREVMLPWRFEPRPYQMNLFKARDRDVRRIMCVWHRRAGKDKCLINLVAREAFRRVGAYYYYFPTAVWARKAVWDGMDKDGFPFRRHFPDCIIANVHDRDMQIEFVNGSIFQVIGTDTLDVVGVNPVGCVFSEYSLQNPKAWQYITPILNENEGWAAFNFTPRGKNHAYKLWKVAKDSPDWFCEVLTVADTGAIRSEYIERDIATGVISRELAEQEYMCSFEFGMEGSVFGSYLREARAAGRIGDFPFDRRRPVFTFWDLGVSDAMSVWFGQVGDSGEDVTMIAHMEENNRGLDWFAKELEIRAADKGYRYGGHFAPHDASKRQIADGASIVATAAKYGLRFEVVPRTPSIEADVELCRRMLPRFRFDERNCGDGLVALADFRRDAETGRPVMTDWTSHAVDAFRTCCRAIELGMLSSQMRMLECRDGRDTRPRRTENWRYNPMKWQEDWR